MQLHVPIFSGIRLIRHLRISQLELIILCSCSSGAYQSQARVSLWRRVLVDFLDLFSRELVIHMRICFRYNYMTGSCLPFGQFHGKKGFDVTIAL